MAIDQVTSGNSEVEHTYLIIIWIKMVWNGSNLSLKSCMYLYIQVGKYIRTFENGCDIFIPPSYK